ncbi:DMT family transporter [Halobellus sp. Atlit-31R]|nr:DMT family transporter [Halobellus sp. Atlit-31R]
MNDETLGVALVVASAVGFGTLGIFGVVAGDRGLTIPTVLALRFALATVVVWGVLWHRGKLRLPGARVLGTAFLLGAGGYATQSALYFVGLEFMTAGMVAIVLYTYPAFVVCLTALVHPERVTRAVVGALGLSIGGVALVTGVDPAGVDPRGVLAVLGAAFAYSLYIIVSQRTLTSVDAETLTAFVLPAAAASFLTFGIGTGSFALPVSLTGWGAVLGIAVFATVVPVLTFFAGIAKIGASRASIISTAEPGVTVALGALVLDEPVSAVTVAGGILVVAGVIIIQRESTV